MPREFVELDLGGVPTLDPTQLRSLFPTAPDAPLTAVASAQEQLTAAMLDHGVRYAATVLARSESDPTRLTTAFFTVAEQRVELTGTRPLEELVERLAEPDLRREMDFFDLPAGRALAVVEDREVRPGGTLSGAVDESVHLVRQLQLFLPFPDREGLAVFALATECLADWPEYVDIMGAIAKTVRVADDRPAVGQTGILDAMGEPAPKGRAEPTPLGGVLKGLLDED